MSPVYARRYSRAMRATLGILLGLTLAQPVGEFVPPRILATVKSPDDRTAIELRRWPTGRPNQYGPVVYHVTRDGTDVLVDSPLGIRRADQDFAAATLAFVGADNFRTIDERYTTRSGKTREHHVIARERTIHFKNPAGAPIDITLRAQNDGVAFRYQFPDRSGGAKNIVEETTRFHVPDRSSAWMLPRQPVGRYAPAYEDLFRELPAGTSADLPDGWDLPALFKTPIGRWVLVTESALDESYAGSHLSQRARDNLYRV